MEVRIEEIKAPAKICWNFEELKAEISAKVQHYELLVYGEEQIQEAKKNKATLNKLKKALNDERIKQERDYMKSFNEFKEQVNELIGIIDKPIAAIDSQLMAFEEQRIEEKKIIINILFNTAGFPDWVDPEKVIEGNWLNASVSGSAIKCDLELKKIKILADIETLSSLPEFAFEAIEQYKQTLDINIALNEAMWQAELKRKKAEHEAKKVTHDSGKQWLSFSALLSKEDADALKQLFLTRNIQFKQI